MTINPKKTFQESVHAKNWENVAGSVMFVSAISSALLEMQNNLKPAKESLDAVANYYRMQGAQTFALELMNLTTAEPIRPERKDTGNLDHSA